MITQFDSSEDTLRRKRLKVSSACTSCRKRKTKCDGSRPCASCTKAKVGCQYVSSNRNNTNKNKNQQKHTNTTSSSRPTTNTIYTTAELKQIHQQQSVKPFDDLPHQQLSSSLQQPSPANVRSPSIPSIAITPRPSLSRHSFSHMTPHSGYSERKQQQYQQPPPPAITISSIEERLEKIERILWMILEKHTSTLDHGPILNNEKSNMTASQDPSIRLPPLYQHHYHPPPTSSPPFGNNTTSSSPGPIRSLLDSETPNAPSLSSSPPSSPFVMHVLKPADLSSPPPLPPVITALHSPHDSVITTGQHFLQISNTLNKNT